MNNPETAVISFNREEHREIKNYTKEQFENYINQVYATAERAGRQVASIESFNEGASKQGEFMLDAIGEVLRVDMSFDEQSVQKLMSMLSEKMTTMRGADEEQ